MKDYSEVACCVCREDPEMVELLKECLEAIEMEYGVCEGCTTDPCMKCRTKALLAKVQGGKR